MCSEAFKDQAAEFYKRLDDISMSSDGNWIKKYFVDRLDDWPHIKRADEAMGGLISQVMTVVANNPRFPNWWRSYSIALRRGDPVVAINSCHDVLKSPEVKDFTEEEVLPFTVKSGGYLLEYKSRRPKRRK